MARSSWRVVRREPSLMVLPLTAGLATVVAAAIIFAPAVALSHGHSQTTYLPSVVIGAYVFTFIGVYFRVAFTLVVNARLEGHRVSIGTGISLAWQRVGVIGWWTFVSASVGLILRALRELPGVGGLIESLVASVVGFVWGALTFFVVPALAIEGLGTKPSIQRSVQVIRARWGEAIGGFVGVNAAFIVFLLPAIALGVLGAVAVGSAPAVGVALFVLAALALLGAMLLGTTLQQVFQVVLFRFATDREIPAEFSRSQLESAVRPRRRRGLLGR